MPNLERPDFPEYRPARGTPHRGLDILSRVVANLEGNPQRKRELGVTFATSCLRNLAILPTRTQLVDYQVQTTSLAGMFMPVDEAIHNGDFNFGGDVEGFVSGMAAIYGANSSSIAKDLILELDLFAHYQEQGVPAELHLFITRDEDTGDLINATAVRPLFPEDMSREERIRIVMEGLNSNTRSMVHDLGRSEMFPENG